MIKVGTYCVDSTEVTRAQYDAWLATNPAGADQAAECAWNSDFSPSSGCMSALSVCQGPCSNHPQVCVDWCDASAYCKGVGKRLCGAQAGGANAWNDFAATSSQWFNACSSANQNAFPYGATYDPQVCNGKEKGLATTASAGSLTGCTSAVSGFSGLLDMSGNVWEWEDSCNGSAGDSDTCRIRGGSFVSYEPSLRCDVANMGARSNASYAIGFRCCSL